MADSIPHSVKNSEWCLPSRYSDVNFIANGTFGTICSGLDGATSRMVAIKKLLRPFYSYHQARRTYVEISLLSHLRHENIISLLEVFTPQSTRDDFRDVYLMLEKMDGDLSTFLKNHRPSTEDTRFVVYQILCALKYLHNAEMIHADLKPKNIGVNEGWVIKLLDFGSVKEIKEGKTLYLVTRCYKAPELKMKWLEYNEKVDIWSVGCIMAEMFTGKSLFKGNDDFNEIELIIELVGSPGEDLVARMVNDDIKDYVRNDIPSQERMNFKEFFGESIHEDNVIDFLDKILVLDPDRRISVNGALSHPCMAALHQAEEITTPDFQHILEDVDNIDLEIWKDRIWQIIKEFPR